MKKSEQRTTLHFRSSRRGGFEMFCGLTSVEVNYWTYLDMYKSYVGGRKLCPECAKWINLQILAEAEL